MTTLARVDYAGLTRQIKVLANRSELLHILEDSGPFDGQCLVCAMAFQRIFNGTLYGCYTGGDDEHWEHSVVRVEDYYLDFDGFSTRNELFNRWRHAENCVFTHVRPTPYREIQQLFDYSPAKVDGVTWFLRKELRRIEEPT